MLFRRKLPKACQYCRHSTQVDDEFMLCVKKGIVSGDKTCAKFHYDPLKRIPVKAKAPDFQKYSDEDFSL